MSGFATLHPSAVIGGVPIGLIGFVLFVAAAWIGLRRIEAFKASRAERSSARDRVVARVREVSGTATRPVSRYRVVSDTRMAERLKLAIGDDASGDWG